MIVLGGRLAIGAQSLLEPVPSRAIGGGARPAAGGFEVALDSARVNGEWGMSTNTATSTAATSTATV